MGIFFIIFLGLAIISPGPSEAQFCRDEIACSTVYSMGSVSDLVLCQYFRPVSDIPRGYVDYVFCQGTADSNSRNCNHKFPKGLPQIALMESEWINETVRCAKLCGACPGGWEYASQR